MNRLRHQQGLGLRGKGGGAFPETDDLFRCPLRPASINLQSKSLNFTTLIFDGVV